MALRRSGVRIPMAPHLGMLAALTFLRPEITAIRVKSVDGNFAASLVFSMLGHFFNRLTLLGLVCLGVSHGSAVAQVQKETLPTASIRAGSIKLEPASLPSEIKFSPAGSRRDRSESSWIHIQAEFQTLKPHAESVRVVFYVEAYDILAEDGVLVFDSKKPKFVILKREVVFQDVPGGDTKTHHLASVYLHPNSARRYRGRDGKELNSKNVNVRVEVDDGSGVVPLDMMADREDWVKTAAGEVTEVLLPVTETPWWPIDVQKYNLIKKTSP